jgi:hypothetical protein
MREQVLCLIQKTRAWEALPAIERIRFVIQHAPVTEATIERKHAMISGATRSATNHLAPFDSVHGLRKTEITDIFMCSADEIKCLAESFEERARAPSKCIQSVGLQAHPEIAKYVRETGGGLRSTIPIVLSPM